MKSAAEIAIEVSNNMPSIGFLSRQKRIEAFNFACYMIEELSIDEEGNLDYSLATEAVSILSHINSKFYKSYVMTITNYNRIPIGLLGSLAHMTIQSYLQKQKL